MNGSRPRYTVPNPPTPIFSTISYFPSFSIMNSLLSSAAECIGRGALRKGNLWKTRRSAKLIGMRREILLSVVFLAACRGENPLPRAPAPAVVRPYRPPADGHLTERQVQAY